MTVLCLGARVLKFLPARLVARRGLFREHVRYPVSLGIFARREEALAACHADAASMVLLPGHDVRCKV